MICVFDDCRKPLRRFDLVCENCPWSRASYCRTSDNVRKRIVLECGLCCTGNTWSVVWRSPGNQVSSLYLNSPMLDTYHDRLDKIFQNTKCLAFWTRDHCVEGLIITAATYEIYERCFWNPLQLLLHFQLVSMTSAPSWDVLLGINIPCFSACTLHCSEWDIN